jgi:hypothetical protein
MPLALTGSLRAVQFRRPAELPLTLDKIECFAKALLQLNLLFRAWAGTQQLAS